MCAMLEMQKMGTREKVTMPQNFMAFRNSYLFVYSLMMAGDWLCLLYTSPSPRDLSTSRMPSSA